jgi:hypothetical protein
MDAPAAQGACGFVGQKETIELSDVTIQTTNDYAAIHVVSMDKKSISASSKILIQVGTVYQPSGWKETPEDFELNGKTVSGFKIENTGKMPWKCANTQLSLKIRNNTVSKATVLDAAGYSKSEINLQRNGEELQLTLPENAMYVILENTTHSEIQQKLKMGMNVFPNPANGSFNVEILNFKPGNYSFELIGLTGQKILDAQKIHNATFKIEVQNKQEGIFLAVLKNEGEILGVEKVSFQNN